MKKEEKKIAATKMSEFLAPCKNCCGEAHIYKIDKMFAAVCDNCVARTKRFKTEREAKSAWNAQ